MEEPIKKDDLVVNGALASIKKDIDALSASTNKWDEELKAAAETLKNAVGGTNKTTLENLNKLNAAEKESARLAKEKKTVVKNQNLLDQEKTKLQKQILVEEAKLKLARSDENKQLQELRAQKNAENKAIRDGIRDKKNDENAYKKLSRESREFKNESKRLGAELLALGSRTEKNAATWDKLQREYTETTQKAKLTDQQLKKLDHTVGDGSRTVGLYGTALNGASRALGAFGIAMGIGSIIRGVSDTVVQFDSAIADLSAITGATGKDLDFFKENAIALGVNVKGGAAAVVEAYKLIGSAKPELLENAAALNQVTEASILLAKASGMELPEAATALTDAMNQFGVGADQAAKFVDVLASGAKFGSAEIPQITQALLKFGAVAKTSNVNIQESTALIENLAENGLKGAEAGTALRNVMLKLSAPDALPKEARDMMRDLGINFDELTDKSRPFSERLDALKPLLNDNAALIKVFGTENAVAATTLLSTTDRIAELTEQVDSNGVALEQANTRSATVSEAFNKLKETFNGIILSFANGTDAASGFASVLDFLANNLGTIVSTLSKLVIGYAAYRTTLIAVNIVQAIQEKGLKGIAKEFFNVSKGANAAEKSNSKLGKTLKAIGWAAIAALVVEVAMAMWDIASGAARARFETELLEKAQARFSGVATKLVDNLNSKLDKQIKLIQQRRELGEITAEEEKKQIEEAIALADKQVQSEQKGVEAQIKQKEAQLNMINEVLKANEFAAGFAEMGSDAQNFLGINNATDIINMASKLEAELKALKDTETLLSNESGRLRDRTADLNHEFKVQEAQAKDTTDATKEQAKAVKNVRLETEKLRELDASILDDGTQDLNFDSLAGLNASFDQEFKLFELNLRKQGLTQEEFDRQMLEKRREILEKQIALYQQYGIDTTDLELELARTQNNAIDKTLNERVELIRDANELITEIITANIDRRLEEYDREIEAARRTQDELKQLAAEGNITAQQSIKEERQNEIEALAEKQKLEEQKNAIKLISSGVSTYLQQIEGGAAPGEAFANTATSLVALKEFLAGFNFFAVGTENAPEGKAVVDEQGAEMIIRKKTGKIELGSDKGARMTWLNKGDIVKTAPETKKLLNNLSMVENAPAKMDNAGTSYDLLGRKLDKLIEVSQNGGSKGQYDFDPIMKELVKRTNTNGDTHVSRYRVKHR